ncbi:MAG: MSMEG_0565 family glycosyltransferase [Marmoricola sp.]
MTTGGPKVALVTYSTKPRGGVAHTLAVGEALHALGAEVVVVGLGDRHAGFYRSAAVPTRIVPSPVVSGGLEEKVAANIDALEAALVEIAHDHPLLHAQDCIAARAAARVRDAGADVVVLRTVHHVDDFDSATLMDCQRRAILEPDHVFVVSETWRRILRDEYATDTALVRNGVDVARYSRQHSRSTIDRLRARVGATDRPLVLAVGGIEPRKGSDTLVQAMSRLAHARTPPPVLAVVGGHSFQDHRAYRERVLASLEPLGLELGVDVVRVGTVPEGEMEAWYAAADVLAFPSVKEGFGLAALEAMCAGLPVVTSDLPVFREWLEPGRDALVAPIGDARALADALATVLDDHEVRTRLTTAGRRLADRWSWEVSARGHLEHYAAVGQVSASLARG